ncbi:hypothetical protein IFR05_010073 [Cadophora sp. M221]|nr:hypothetical protein IFR05_010073 [Cadophora sp. M221]
MSQTQDQAHTYKYDLPPAIPPPPDLGGRGSDVQGIPLDLIHTDTKMANIPAAGNRTGTGSQLSAKEADARTLPLPLPLPRVSSTSTLLGQHTSPTRNSGATEISTPSVTAASRCWKMGRRSKGSDVEEGGEGEGGNENGVVGDGGHEEKHTNYGPVVRDVIIGGADGLTVPFALTAGLSSLGSTKLVIIGGLAELFSGAISMGLGAYLAAVTERDHYLCEEQRERDEVRDKPDEEREECYVILEKYGVPRETLVPVIDALASDAERWVEFMMDFELKLEKPNISRAWISGATMGLSYFVGGLIPMIPYFIMSNVTHALFVSIAVTVLVLIVFGFAKNYIVMKTTRAGFYGAAQTLIIGVLAAGTSYGIVRAIDSKGGTGMI